jgi:N-acetylglutamate synthase-like GNAT family acetyltransferase
MIRTCTDADTADMLRIINDAAEAYRGIIPADRWKEPYMPMAELREELDAGVRFSGCMMDGELVGVMGMQNVQDVALIRHAYTLTRMQGKGIGAALLDHLVRQADRPLLVGTWAAADWAVRFYQGRGFTLVDEAEKHRLLKKYWTIPERQIETSVVLRN